MAQTKKIITRSVLKHSKQNTLSPLIFTKKTPVTRQQGKTSKFMTVFENTLTCVVQAYYQASYDVESTMKEIRLEIDDNSDVESSRKNSKVGRRAKSRKVRLSLVKVGGGSMRESPTENAEGSDFDEMSLLNYLVSPLKNDLAFGDLNRNMVSEGDRDLRNGHLHIRQEV